MQYYCKYNAAYEAAVRRGAARKIRVELLNEDEYVVGDITQEVIDGTVNAAYQQGVRRTANITITGDAERIPASYRIRILCGVCDGADVFWWPLGVYYAKSYTVRDGTSQMELVDKFGALSGELSRNVLQSDYCAPQGTHFSQLVYDVLSMETGNGHVVDCKQAYIDTELIPQTLPYEVVVSVGGNIGDLLKEIASCCGADIYYDAAGHLVMTTSTGEDYENYGFAWQFAAQEVCGYSASTDYSGAVNSVMVYGYDATGKMYSATAENDAPNSPVRVSLVGRIQAKPIESAMCNTHQRCVEYSGYELRKQSVLSSSDDFRCIPAPHLDVNRVIGMPQEIDDAGHVVSGITMPLRGLYTVKSRSMATLETGYTTNSIVQVSERPVAEPNIVMISKTIRLVNPAVNRIYVPALTASSTPATIDWGDGATESYDAANAITHDYDTGGEKTVSIYGATSIKERAFESRTTFPGACRYKISTTGVSLTELSFYYGGFEEITIDNVDIPAESLWYCATIEVNAPNAKTIGAYAFKNTAGLTTLSIPCVEEIGNNAFEGCVNLTGLTVPVSCTSIGEAAFSGCNSMGTMNYGGTMAQWALVTLGNNWNYTSGSAGTPKYVVCTDGRVTV